MRVNDPQEVADRLEEYIRRRFTVADDDPYFTRRVNLAEEGYVDSVGLVEVIVFLDDGFGVSIPDMALFALDSLSIQSLASLVAGLPQRRDAMLNGGAVRREGGPWTGGGHDG